jgi:tRNA A-37 threonylcarbamoyl transferase component Bud32
VGKLWDGYKHSAADRDHEVEVYMHLQSLWGREVPRLIGCGTLDFCWALLVERVQVRSVNFGGNILQAKELSAGVLNPTVTENVLTAFRDIHALGVIHSDIRTQNILVKEDHSVVIIDFEFSSFKDVTMDQIALEDEEIEDLLDNLRGVGCLCKGSPGDRIEIVL